MGEPLGGRQRFVGVTDERADGFVEFLFAIEDPHLSVELIMPRAAFDEFCDAQHVKFLPIEDMQAHDCGRNFDWSLKKARDHRLG